MFEFNLVSKDQDYDAAFEVMRELRPHLIDVETFKTQVQRQQLQQYYLLAAWQDKQLQGLAGYRIQENLIYGKFLYVDDLITTASVRSQGLGQQLIEQLRLQAKKQDCTYLVLDTGLENALGQRFYYRQGLLAKAMHFRQALV